MALTIGYERLCLYNIFTLATNESRGFMDFHFDLNSFSVLHLFFLLPLIIFIWRVVKYLFASSVSQDSNASGTSFQNLISYGQPDVDKRNHKKKTVRGSDHAFSWVMIAEWIKNRSFQSGFRSDTIRQNTKWFSQDLRFDQGKYLLIMTLPRKMSIPDIKNGGFINTLINWFAEKLLKFFVASYFGSDFKKIVNLHDSKIFRFEKEQDYHIFSNDFDRVSNLLDDNLKAFLTDWRTNYPAVAERKQIGILVSEEGIIVSSQLAYFEEPGTQQFLDFSLAVSRLLKR